MRSLALLAFRVIVGGIFAVHGYPKLFGGPGRPVHPIAARYLGAGFGQSMEHGGVSSFAAVLRGLEVPFPDLMAWVVALVEFKGGILIAVGWCTRPAGLLLAADMAVAIRKVHWRNGLLGPGGFELPLALLGGCLGLIGAGPGDLSVDGLLQKKKRAVP